MMSSEMRLRWEGRAPTRQSSAVRTAGTVTTVLFGGAAAMNLASFAIGASPFPMTHLAATVLALYLLAEANLYLRRCDTFGLLSPVFMALFGHFFLAYLLAISLAGFMPDALDRFGYWIADLDQALAKTHALAVLAAFSMLRGYGLARSLAGQLRRKVERMPEVRKEIQFDFSVVLAVQIAYLALVLYAIEVGAYGLLSTVETREKNIEIQQFLNLALSAGTLSYFLILLRYFERRSQGRAGLQQAGLIVSLIALHVIAGALAAFKSQIVWPFVIAAFAYYFVNRRIPILYSGLIVLALVASYKVVEPFRAYLGLHDQPPQSASEAIQSLGIAIYLTDELMHANDLSRSEQIAQRFDLSGMTTLAVDYVDRGQLRDEIRYEFQDSILLAPVLAFVPRFIWQNKPVYSRGVWFNQEVRGRWNDDRTSVGMGPIGFLYMAGGVVGVAMGFFALGLLQALIFEGIGRVGAGGLIIYLSVATTLVMIPSSFGLALAGVLRMLPIAFAAQWALLRRRRGSPSRRG